jgi:hypothetical protein
MLAPRTRVGTHPAADDLRDGAILRFWLM